MAGFIRRYLSDPGIEEIRAIEGVIIIDREPPGAVSGVGSGTVLVVGEFEDGPFATPTEVFSGGDLITTFGEFGFSYDGVVSSNPCARSRKADAALVSEFWNGNGFMALVNKRFRRLVIQRVDTSVGAVQFTRLPALSGNANFNWDLEPAQTVVLALGDANAATATFSATAASRDSGGGAYPTNFVGGEKFNITIDENTPQQIGPVDVIFLSTDQVHADVVNRINAVLGYTAASVQAASVTRIVGRVRGSTGNVRVNSVDASVTTETGIAAGTTMGTGNVGNIDQVSFVEAKNVIEAGIAGTRVDRDSSGRIRISATAASVIRYTTASTADAFGFVEETLNQQPGGFAVFTTAEGIYPNGFAGGETITLGFDNDPNVTVTFQAGDTTKAAVISRINAAFAGFGFVPAVDAGTNKIRLSGRLNGGQVRLIATSTPTVATNTGISGALLTYQAVANIESFIPAGTRVRNSAGAEWVTMQTVGTAESNAGPYSVKVRPALDDGTALTTVPLSATVFVGAAPAGSFSVTNSSALSAALTEAQIDAAYVTAFNATKAASTVAKEVNIIVSARQSNAVRQIARQNAIEASDSGLFGRMAVVRPPLGTKRAAARSGAQAPGVGATRSDRVVYCYPGVHTFVPQIATRGLAGGAGFTVDGLVDVGFDSWVASVMSQLPPEENPGQETNFALGVVGLERGNSDVQAMEMADYKAFRAAGIAAARMDGGKCIIQSGVTSVDPLVSPNLVNIARRRMADFIQDSLANRLKSFSKKLATRQRRGDLVGEIDGFCAVLLSENNPASQRIEAYAIDAKSGNTLVTLAAGIFRIILRVQTLPSLDFIVLETIIGESVDVTVNELPLAA